MKNDLDDHLLVVLMTTGKHFTIFSFGGKLIEVAVQAQVQNILNKYMNQCL